MLFHNYKNKISKSSLLSCYLSFHNSVQTRVLIKCQHSRKKHVLFELADDPLAASQAVKKR